MVCTNVRSKWKSYKLQQKSLDARLLYTYIKTYIRTGIDGQTDKWSETHTYTSIQNYIKHTHMKLIEYNILATPLCHHRY